jgi:hypothetical protein
MSLYFKYNDIDIDIDNIKNTFTNCKCICVLITKLTNYKKVMKTTTTTKATNISIPKFKQSKIKDIGKNK